MMCVVCNVWYTHTPLQGLLNSDRHLAAALWRQLYDSQTNIDVHKLNALVRYVRRTVCARGLMGSSGGVQVYEMHQLDRDTFLADGVPGWKQYIHNMGMFTPAFNENLHRLI